MNDDFELRLRELIKKEKAKFKWFIVDNFGEILSEGYKTKHLALHFLPNFRLHKRDKLRVIKMEVNNDERI